MLSPSLLTSLSKHSMLILVSLMLRSSLMHPLLSLPAFKMALYRGVGSRWMNGMWLTNRFVHIC